MTSENDEAIGLDAREPERFLVLFSFLDYVLAVLPLALLSTVCVFGALAGLLNFDFLFGLFCVLAPFAWLLIWLTLQISRAIMSRRDPAMARKYRERFGMIFRALAVLIVLGNMLVIPALGVEVFMWTGACTSGFVYVSVRHLLLIYLDEKREALEGVPLDDSSPDL